METERDVSQLSLMSFMEISVEEDYAKELEDSNLLDCGCFEIEF